MSQGTSWGVSESTAMAQGGANPNHRFVNHSSCPISSKVVGHNNHLTVSTSLKVAAAPGVIICTAKHGPANMLTWFPRLRATPLVPTELTRLLCPKRSAGKHTRPKGLLAQVEADQGRSLLELLKVGNWLWLKHRDMRPTLWGNWISWLIAGGPGLLLFESQPQRQINLALGAVPAVRRRPGRRSLKLQAPDMTREALHLELKKWETNISIPLAHRSGHVIGTPPSLTHPLTPPLILLQSQPEWSVSSSSHLVNHIWLSIRRSLNTFDY